ncbi:MAG: hypothetical protein WCK99_12155, partial [Mycobacteriaceae bacterium]
MSTVITGADLTQEMLGKYHLNAATTDLGLAQSAAVWIRFDGIIRTRVHTAGVPPRMAVQQLCHRGWRYSS